MATYDELIQQGYSRGEALRATSGTSVTAPAALTAPATMNAAYTQSEVQALRNDVAALQSKLTALINVINAGL